ncbi:hypothetical protein Dimus_012143 [Dionaea muscipula]
MAGNPNGNLFPSSSSTAHLVVFLIALTIITPITISNPNPSNPAAVMTSAHELLQSYNFPAGLLPKGVIGYDLDESTGKFAAYMKGTCGFSLEGSYQLEYKSTIRGYISNGKLESLEGVQVKIFSVLGWDC